MTNPVEDFFYVLTIVVSAVSTVVSFAGCFLYHIYSRDKNGRLLRMITWLVFADGVSSFCFILWYILNTLDFLDDNMLCSLIWPVQLFSFLCAFGLIIMIANRFKRVNTGHSKKEHLNFPLSVVPLVAFLLTLPTIIVDQAVQSTHITELISNTDADNNEFCFFNSSVIGTIVNYITLQLPSLITITYNIHAYHQGVTALQSSSPEVHKKSRFKAGKYLFVLLLVWIPSIIVHAYHSTISRANEPYFPVLVVILLTSCQGIFNAVAYAWEYYPFRKWVYEKMLRRPYEINAREPNFAPGIFRLAKPLSDQNDSVLATPLIESEKNYAGSESFQFVDCDTENSLLSAKSIRRDHLTDGERSVRFGPTSQHVISVCSVYDDDDDDDDAESVDATLEETADEVRKSVFKFIKRIFRYKKNEKHNIEDSIGQEKKEDDEDYEDAILEHNTDINSTTDFFTSRRREKRRRKEERGSSNDSTRSRSRSRSRSTSRSPSPQPRI